MADWFGAAESLLGGIGSVLGGNAEAKGFKQAAAYYEKAAKYAGIETRIKERMTRREIFKTVGGAQADVAHSGLRLAGSAIDVIKDSAREGALSLSLVRLQGDIEQSSYMAQAAQAASSASSSKKSGGLGGILGAVGAVASLFSDDDLKENIEFLWRRPDGIGIYQFSYKGGEGVYRGVMASEIEILRPDATIEVDGFRKVDYDKLGVEFERVN
jgi:hypothetical protein